MSEDSGQLQKNRGKVALVAFGLLMLGLNGPEIGDMFGDDEPRGARHHERFEAKIDAVVTAAEDAAERKAEAVERKIEAIEREAEAIGREAEAAERKVDAIRMTIDL